MKTKMRMNANDTPIATAAGHGIEIRYMINVASGCKRHEDAVQCFSLLFPSLASQGYGLVEWADDQYR